MSKRSWFACQAAYELWCSALVFMYDKYNAPA